MIATNQKEVFAFREAPIPVNQMVPSAQIGQDWISKFVGVRGSATAGLAAEGQDHAVQCSRHAGLSQEAVFIAAAILQVHSFEPTRIGLSPKINRRIQHVKL